MSKRTISSRRQFTLGAAATLVAAPGVVRAQTYPSGPVQILVAYGAGGGTDTFARLLAPLLSRVLGQPVTVQNLPGGGGQVAATTLLRDGGDGHAILATNQPDLSISTVFSKPPYKLDDFQIAMVDVIDPRIMLVQKESKIATLADFASEAKAQPNKLAVSVAQGSAQELFAKWLFAALGVQVRLVGYNGGAPASNAMLAGDVTANLGDDSARMNIRDKSKALFVGAARKSPRWPEAETLSAALAPLKASPPSPDFLARFGVYVVPSAFKAKHPAAYAKLQHALVNARKEPEFEQYIAKTGLGDLSVGKPGEAFADAFAKDVAAVSALRG